MSLRNGIVDYLRKIGLLAITASVVTACDPRPREIVGDVVESSTSPDSTLRAILSRANYGATVPYVYRVYIEDSDTGQLSEVLRVDNAMGFSIEWARSDLLKIHMTCGRVFAFNNFSYAKTNEGLMPHLIEIQLITGGLCP